MSRKRGKTKAVPGCTASGPMQRDSPPSFKQGGLMPSSMPQVGISKSRALKMPRVKQSGPPAAGNVVM